MTTKPTQYKPAGIKLTQAQLDESQRESYRILAIRAGLDYYACGRFSVAHAHIPVCGNILHHAVEMMLKGCLAYDDTLEQIRKYGAKKVYHHDLRRLWEAFKGRQTEPVPVEFDQVIQDLHAFDGIRYPDNLIRLGGRMIIDRYDVPDIALPDTQSEPLYRLKFPQIDRLMGLLFKAAHANPDFFLPPITDDEHNMQHYNNLRSTLFGVGPSTIEGGNKK